MLLRRRQEFVKDQLNQSEGKSQEGKKDAGYGPSEKDDAEIAQSAAFRNGVKHLEHEIRLYYEQRRQQRKERHKNPFQPSAIILLNKKGRAEGGR
jgi:hypothetical protein